MLTSYTGAVRMYSLMFGFIALVMLAMFVIYVVRGPVDPLIAGGLVLSFLACLVPTLYLLKPYESREDFLQRKEERDQMRKSTNETRDPGS
ncbi:hypothetical protein BH23ACT11_BH23ACT11_30510 [soil metagenome]